MIDTPDSGARHILQVCTDLQRDEHIGIAYDTPERKTVAEYLHRAALQLGGRATLIPVTEAQTMPDAPLDELPQAAYATDVLVGVTGRSMYHATLGREAARRGQRVLALTQCRVESLTSPALTADFIALAPVAQRFAERLGDADRIHLTTTAGTDITARLQNRDGYACTGLARTPGQRNGCPDIESYVAPVENTITGIVVVNASSTPFGLVNEPVQIEIENGIARSVTGGGEATRIEKYLKSQGDPALQFAEFGFGLSPTCRVIGQIVEDEGTYGTGHVAFGSNDGFGGANPAAAHVDLVYWQPTIQLDDEPVIQDGRLICDPDFNTAYQPTPPPTSPSRS